MCVLVWGLAGVWIDSAKTGKDANRLSSAQKNVVSR